MGLHRRETYDAMQTESERIEVMLLFWSIFVLDRRWSFGTGMPFALQDSDIDPMLPKPDSRSPYLSAMIQYASIGSKVWRSVGVPTTPTSPTSIPGDTEEMGYLDYQVVQWLANVAESLQFDRKSISNNSERPGAITRTSTADRLPIVLYLRANQMRILIYRPILHTATTIMQHRAQAEKVVNIAKDTIQLLTHLNQTCDLYQRQQVLFNAFLSSALAVLFLSVSHAPTTFADNVREEFHMALDLVRGMSKGSFVSKRLWRTVRLLKEVGPKLGLCNRDAPSTSATATVTAAAPARTPSNQQHSAVSMEMPDPNRSAAVAMAGLAGHNVDEVALYANDLQTTSWPNNPQATFSPGGMVDDLTNLFEAVGRYEGVDDGGMDTALAYNVRNLAPDDVDVNNMAGGLVGDETLANIFKDLF